jgi:hypothetical protein
MGRLIDANVVRQKLQEIIDETQNWRNQKASKIGAWRHVDEIYKLDNWLGVYAECADLIDEAHTVDAVEVVHARWKDGECTACGFDIRDMIDGDSDFRNWVWEGIPYCPNCGAKMDGGNEDG